MSRPLIGVTGPHGRGWALWAAAAASLRLAGARARRLAPPLEPNRLADLDGLMIGGGDDVGAELYGGEVRPNVRLDPPRDALELTLLERLWAGPLPILGVCRGAQIMNVFRGGTLHRDVREAYSLRRHPRTPLALKRVRLEPESRLMDAIRIERFRVNSLHAQAVDRLGEGLRVAARDEHGMIQAIEHAGARFRIGVQWHPELLMYKRPHRRLFIAFVAAARAAAGG